MLHLLRCILWLVLIVQICNYKAILAFKRDGKSYLTFKSRLSSSPYLSLYRNYPLFSKNEADKFDVLDSECKNGDFAPRGAKNKNFTSASATSSMRSNIPNAENSEVDGKTGGYKFVNELETESQEGTGDSTRNLSLNVKSMELLFGKLTQIWQNSGLKDDVFRVLELFKPDPTEQNGESCVNNLVEGKTKLECQLSGLVDYNNLEKRLEALIIKEYDKAQEGLKNLDVLFQRAEKIDMFLDINKATPVPHLEKPSITKLIFSQLTKKVRQLNKFFMKFCNKYLFSSKIIKLIINIVFPVFKPDFRDKRHFNINEMLNFYELPLSEDFVTKNIQIQRNGLPSGHKNAWRFTFIGTGSRRITTVRGASAIALEPKGSNGPIWLFDCGEGTRLSLLKLGMSPTRVEKIFLTHLHGDHSLGVFSFISDLSKWGKVEIYGPNGIQHMIDTVHSVISRCYSHKCIIKELDGIAFNPPTKEVYNTSNHLNNMASKLQCGLKARDGQYNILEAHNIKVVAVPIRHNLPTVGYILDEVQVQEGKTPRKICLLQDTCDATQVAKFVKSPDLVIHESTYSTITLLGTKQFIKERNLEALEEIAHVEYAKSCYDAASAFAMDIANVKRAEAVKKIPSYLIAQLNGMKERQAMFSHGMISNDRQSVIKYQLMLLYNLKRRLLILENLTSCINLIADSIEKLEYFKTFQNRKQLLTQRPTESPKSASDASAQSTDSCLVKFWKDAIKPQLNICKFTISSIASSSNFSDISGKDGDTDTGVCGVSGYNVFQKIIEDIVWIYGHSTEAMAGRMAGILRAKTLVLTHFSSRMPGDNNLESILTMKRVEANARREMEFAAKHIALDASGNLVVNAPNVESNASISAGRKKKSPRVVTAWDGFYIDVPPH